VFWFSKPCGTACTCEHLEKFNVIAFRLEGGVHLPDYTLSSKTPRAYQISVSSHSMCTYQISVSSHSMCTYQIGVSSHSMCTYQISVSSHSMCTYQISVSSHSMCTYQAAYCHHVPCPNIVASYRTHEEHKVLITSSLLI